MLKPSTGDQSGAAEVWWSSKKKFLPYSNNIEEILQNTKDQTAHVWSNIDAPKDPNHIDVSE